MTNDLVSLNISETMIKEIVSKQIQQAIVRELGNTEEYMQALVGAALHQKVSEKGTLSNYSSDNKFDYLDIMLRNRIQEAARKAFNEYPEENSELLKTALKKELSETAKKDALVNAFIDAASKGFGSVWNFKCDVHFLKRED
jgi:hypothetical protein